MSAAQIQHDPEPIAILKFSCAWARMNGIRVRIGSFGVSPVAGRGATHWEIDPLEQDPGVSPVGAALLFTQPPAVNVGPAAAQALGKDGLWVDTLCEGLGLEPKNPRWMASRRRDSYLNGWEAGACLRIHVLSFRARS